MYHSRKTHARQRKGELADERLKDYEAFPFIVTTNPDRSVHPRRHAAVPGGAPGLGGRGAGVGGHVWPRGVAGGESADGAAARDLGRPRLSAQRRADSPSVFCGDPRGPPRGGTDPLGAVVRMGVCVLPRRDRPRAPLVHLPRRDVCLSLGPPWEKECGVWGRCYGTREVK